jgi:predicted nucleic acid-binding protein
LKQGYLLYTVDIALAECLNVIWKHATLLADLNVEDTKSAVAYLLKICSGLNVIVTRDLAGETMTIAQTMKVPVYDALHIALAKRVNGTLYTADQKLHTTANKTTNTKLLKLTK